MPKYFSPTIVTLQIFPLADGVRVDLGAANAPEHASPAFETLAQALAQVAIAVIADPDLGILDDRKQGITPYPAPHASTVPTAAARAER